MNPWFITPIIVFKVFSDTKMLHSCFFFPKEKQFKMIGMSNINGESF